MLNKKTKDKIWKRDKNICQRCNKQIDKRLNDSLFGGVIHHIDSNRKNNNLDNLILLCGKCHNEIHNVIRKIRIREECYINGEYNDPNVGDLYEYAKREDDAQ